MIAITSLSKIPELRFTDLVYGVLYRMTTSSLNVIGMLVYNPDCLNFVTLVNECSENCLPG
jgi:hypothetical protein